MRRQEYNYIEISYTYKLIHLVRVRLRVSLSPLFTKYKWYFLVNYCSISHLDVENGFIFDGIEIKMQHSRTTDGHNCVFVQQKRESERDRNWSPSLSSLSLYMYTQAGSPLFLFLSLFRVRCSAEGKKMNFFLFPFINLVLSLLLVLLCCCR